MEAPITNNQFPKIWNLVFGVWDFHCVAVDMVTGNARRFNSNVKSGPVPQRQN